MVHDFLVAICFTNHCVFHSISIERLSFVANSLSAMLYCVLLIDAAD